MIRERHQEYKSGIVLVAGSALLAALTAYEPQLAVAASLLMIGILVAAYLVCRPWHLFALYLFLLAAHVPLMGILLVQVGLPAPVVKAISAWKELTLLLFLLVALWHLLQSRWRATIPDLLILFYIFYTLAYLCFSLFESSNSLVTLLYGLRDLILPFLLYMVGRSISLSDKRAHRVFQWLLWAAFIYSLIGIIEWSFIPTQWHADLGIARYYKELLNLEYRPYYLGLPENYWRGTAAGRLRRAASVYGSSQSFATSFLLLLPVSIYGMLTRTLKERHLATLTFIISMIGLVLTITRFTIVICVGLLILASLISSQRARRWARQSLIVMTVAFILALFLSNSFRVVVISTLTFEDHSSSTRLVIWADTARIIMRQPLGYGIGQVGHTVARLIEERAQVVGIEGQMSKIGVELGILGLLLYLSILVVISAYLFITYNRVKEPYIRALCFASALTFIGLLVNSLTTEWHNSIALVYPAWWLAGSCVRVGSQYKKIDSSTQIQRNEN
ncbi:MAG: O-antigen ligase family protein [Ardenticatenaceae bacterium]